MIEAGTVVAVRKSQALVKVLVLGRKTEWLPVLQQANSFRRKFTPVRCGEQVVVLANRYVVGAIFNKDCSEPEGANEHCDVIEYEDGTRITYDTEIKQLSVITAGDVKMKTAGNAEIDAAKEAKVTAPLVNVEGGSGDVVVSGISLVNHTHKQKPGDHFGGGVNTEKPS